MYAKFSRVGYIFLSLIADTFVEPYVLYHLLFIAYYIY